MRIAESIILSTLQKGGCIKTFYRRSARVTGTAVTRIADGYVLESADEREEVILSHTDFSTVEKKLVEAEIWEQVVGVILFGGSTWRLRPDLDG